MKRREFAKIFTAGVATFAASKAASSFADDAPRVAITMDDFRWQDAPRLTADERNRALLEALRSENDLKLALFVAGKNVDNERGKQLLRAWDREGHVIANHTYSHPYYHSRKVTVEDYSADILRCEALIKDYRHFKRLFRFPFLKEGDTADKRDRLRAFLKERGYRTGHVTIDASDWYVDDRLRARLAKDPNADLTAYRDFYLAHIWGRADYYDQLGVRVLGRRVKHTLLVHYNLLNALFLGDLLRMFKAKGWKLTNAEEAFRDPVFEATPRILPAGESLIWALAKETGKFDAVLRYPGEDGEYEKEKMDKLGL
jgi:peptidoglycan/xylan/chitin deacetylase (PgdA/CDA1 family)